MRVVVTRAADFAEATAARLAAAGHVAIFAPATEVERVVSPPPAGPFEAIAATSARGATFCPRDVAQALARTPFYAVGEATAEAARRAGFASPRVGAGDGVALAARIARDLGSGARALLLAGEDRKPEFEAALAGAEIECVAFVVYAARERAAWSADEAAAVAGADAILHHSARSAELACRLAERADVADAFRRALHVCISASASAPLRMRDRMRISVAPLPSDAAMIGALAK